MSRIKRIVRPTPRAPRSEQQISEAAEIAFGGERVTHLHPNDLYYAHLSIYWFALPYIKRRAVLDAGCGAGYGTHYLARHGARSVTGIDISTVAIEACRKYFRRRNLRYEVQDLADIQGFRDHSFDVVFSSNALEHVPDLKGFFDTIHRLLDPSRGTFILAVPPVVNADSRQANLDNPYHLNIWTPRQWKSALDLYFEDVRLHSHLFRKPGVRLDFRRSPEETTISETNFIFPQVTLEEFYTKYTLTIILVATRPKAALPTVQAIPLVDDSLTRPATAG